MYCAEQIQIPGELPEILKNYTKFIIKTQPEDLIAASAEYFGRISRQKNRAVGGVRLTNVQLEAVYKKFKASSSLNFSRHDVDSICEEAGVPASQVADNVILGGWTDSIPWSKFWALLVGSAAGTLHATVDVLCQILGDNDKVPANPLLDILQFLTERDSDIPPQQVASFNQKLQEKGSSKLDIPFIQELFRKEIPAKLGAAPSDKPSKENVKTPEAAPKDTDLEEEL